MALPQVVVDMIASAGCEWIHERKNFPALHEDKKVYSMVEVFSGKGELSKAYKACGGEVVLGELVFG